MIRVTHREHREANHHQKTKSGDSQGDRSTFRLLVPSSMNPFAIAMLASFLSIQCRTRLFVAKQFSRPFRRARAQTSPGESVDNDNFFRGNLTILDQNERYLVVEKTPSVVCHHSEWTGSRSRQEVPMLQRVRDAMGGRHVNLVHRLDRGCSGCLLMTFANDQNKEKDHENYDDVDATSILNDAMQDSTTVKTYIALVRGEGILHGRDFRKEGWFKVDRPITNERGNIAEATTLFRFAAGQDNGRGTIDRPRASIVLCRPSTGRWHQIRKHLNGLSHPILGDSTHGNSKVNREYRKRYGMLAERTCLHLARIDMEPTVVSPNGIHVACPLAPDMLKMLQDHMPDLLREAFPILMEEGVWLEAPNDSTAIVVPYEVALSSSASSSLPTDPATTH